MIIIMRISFLVHIGSFVCLFVICECQSKNSKSDKNGPNDISLDKEYSKTTTTESVKTSLPIEVNFNEDTQEKIPEKPSKLVCPIKGTPRPFFSLRCASTKDCSFLGKGLLCCEKRCIKGVNPPKPESRHSAVFFGMIQRVCPAEPTPEIWEVKECKYDSECEPRICCPEAMKNGEIKGFCRTAQPVWDSLPAPRQIIEPIKLVVGYMQCTPPPPPFLDIFPKTCNNPLDCFPNLCCQEKGKKFCRPPKRSLLSLVAGIGQRFIPENAARKLISRIS